MGQTRDTATVTFYFVTAATQGGQVGDSVQAGETPVVRPHQAVHYLWPLSSWVAWQSWDSEFALRRERGASRAGRPGLEHRGSRRVSAGELEQGVDFTASRESLSVFLGWCLP